MSNQIIDSKLSEELNSFFDKILILSLKRSKDRHTLVKKNFQNVKYEIFWGTDANNHNIEKLKNEVYDPDLTRRYYFTSAPLKPGEVACAISHTDICRYIIDQNLNKVLIFEDDAYFDPAYAGNITGALQHTPENWEFLYLGYNNCQGPMSMTAKLKANFFYPIANLLGLTYLNRASFYRKFKHSYSEYWDHPGFVSGAYAYGISFEGAKKIAAYQTPIKMAHDNAIGQMVLDNTLKAFRLKEAAFLPNREIPSTITGRWD